jgi:hypothetical protein
MSSPLWETPEADFWTKGWSYAARRVPVELPLVRRYLWRGRRRCCRSRVHPTFAKDVAPILYNSCVSPQARITVDSSDLKKDGLVTDHQRQQRQSRIAQGGFFRCRGKGPSNRSALCAYGSARYPVVRSAKL